MTFPLTTLSLLVLGLVAVLLVVLLGGAYLIWRLGRQQRQLRKLIEPLEQTGVLPTAEQLNLFGSSMHQLAGRVAVLEGLGKRQAQQIEGCLQQVGVLRYNPFGDTGGDQSFALALLDKAGSGVVMSSLHGRAGTRVYAKPVTEGGSTYTLTEEEQTVIKQATTTSIR